MGLRVSPAGGPLQPSFLKGSGPAEEPPAIAAVIKALGLMEHPEGGYFVETDRDPWLVPSPFPLDSAAAAAGADVGVQADVPTRPGFHPAVRNASTTIFYLLTPTTPQGRMHRNRGRILHTLHRGRGVFVVVHADEPGCRVESFVVGPDVAAGERLQWIVEGGKYLASFLLPDTPDGSTSAGGMLISETVVPGFEYCDMDFITRDALYKLVGDDKAKGLEWLLL